MPAAASGRITPIGPTICIGRRGRSGDGARNSTKGAADQRPGAGRTRRRADQSAGSRSDQAAANRTLPRIIRIGAGRQRQNERERSATRASGPFTIRPPFSFNRRDIASGAVRRVNGEH